MNNNFKIESFQEDILSIIKTNDMKNIMKAYTFIYDNRFNKKITPYLCYQFRIIYKNIVQILLDEISLNKNDEDVLRRNILLSLHKYYTKKKILDKIFYNFKYCICDKCFKIGSIKHISEELFEKKFKDIPPQYLKYDKKDFDIHIENCKNSLLLKEKIIEDKEFFKRNIFSYF